MLPVRGATLFGGRDRSHLRISIHAPRAGSDSYCSEWPVVTPYFNPCSPCGERLPELPPEEPPPDISIHAPRAGSDETTAMTVPAMVRFQSMLPVRGATWASWRMTASRFSFQSMLPVRGATCTSVSFSMMVYLFQSMLPVRGATPFCRTAASMAKFQSMLPVRGATARLRWRRRRPRFQSMLPVRGATFWSVLSSMPIRISIHAPRAGSDWRRFFGPV